MDWKKQFVAYVCAGLLFIVFIFVCFALNNKEQPSVEDIMTNDGPSIYDFLEK